MRREFIELLIERAENEEFLFLTGDVGYGLLEPLRERLGDRFINCGVAEQNMISLAAGLARSGWEVWVYTISPFCYARAFEQIRNDLSFHRLPVKLLGSGGGYAYGALGPSHHALEDYGTLCTLTNLRVLVPASREELPSVFELALRDDLPCYLRLENGRDIGRREPENWAGWRRWLRGDGPRVITCGPLLSELLPALENAELSDRVSLWSVNTLPLKAQNIPAAFLEGLDQHFLMVLEEHSRQGGLASQLSLALMETGCSPRAFETRNASGYPSGLYGNQQFHRREMGLDGQSVVDRLKEVLDSSFGR